jgi:hypothetical protein
MLAPKKNSIPQINTPAKYTPTAAAATPSWSSAYGGSAGSASAFPLHSGLYPGSVTMTATVPATSATTAWTIGAGGASGTYMPYAPNVPQVNISGGGIAMDANCDIKIGNISLKDFMKTMSERLAILQVDPTKMAKFAALKAAYDHYKLLEALCYEDDKK